MRCYMACPRPSGSAPKHKSSGDRSIWGGTPLTMGPTMKPEIRAAGPPRKRSLTLSRHRTSVSLEDAFWTEFQAIAARQGTSVNGLAARIDRQRGLDIGLASAIRLYVLEDLQAQLASVREPVRDS